MELLDELSARDVLTMGGDNMDILVLDYEDYH